MTLRADLARMFPRAIPAWLDAFERLGPMLAAHYGFDRLDWVHFCGQIDAETNGLSLRKMEENMTFISASRILKVYSYRLGLAIKKVNSGQETEPAFARGKTKEQLAAYLVRKPKALADVVYGGREGTPWMQGSRYQGRGPTQITHLNNYLAIQKEIAKQPGGADVDLLANPELLSTDPELGIRSAFADWEIKGLSRWAQADDCDTLSDALNTGNIRDNVKPHGIDRRRSGTRIAKGIWRGDLAFPAPEPVVADAPEAEPDRVPDVPVTPGDLVGVSRKATLLYRIKQLFGWVGIGGTGAYSFADVTGFGKDTAHALADLFKDNAAILLAAGLIVGFLLSHVLLEWIADDHNEGRYTPREVA